MPRRLPVWDVAEYFIRKAAGQPEGGLTHLKLQKLLYYAQAWHLALEGTPLFDDRIEAWSYGPVVPAVYRKYKDHASQLLEPRDGSAPLANRPAVRAFLDEVWRVYGCYDASYLYRLTHTEAPWQEARGNRAADEACAQEITHESMRRFYGAQIPNNRSHSR